FVVHLQSWDSPEKEPRRCKPYSGRVILPNRALDFLQFFTTQHPRKLLVVAVITVQQIKPKGVCNETECSIDRNA
ncbi:hypothetical protein, partial [Pseudomonas sp.]|uniref:hypothetical protein n=1 Tax=Pseudomonas sp. TaxID=306 RepID=UPI003A9844C6